MNSNKFKQFIIISQFIKAMQLAHPQGKKIFNYYNVDRNMFNDWQQDIANELFAKKWENGEPKYQYKLDDCIVLDNKYNLRQMFINTYMFSKTKQLTLSTKKIVCTLLALKEINSIYDNVTKRYIDSILD